MKRRRGEACALKKDWGVASDSIRRRRFPKVLDPIRNMPETGGVLNSEVRRIRRRRKIGLGKSMVSATVAILGFFSIAGTSCNATSPATATIEDAIPIGRGRHLQTLFQQCKISMAVGDIDRDDLLSRSEYLRFVNQLGGKIWNDPNSNYVEFSDFDTLPQSLKDNFYSFSNPSIGRIDISGAKPGQVPSSEEATKLNDMCDMTALKILDSESNPNPNEQPYPNNPNVDCSDIVDRGTCNVDLSISDSSGNNLLDESEYVTFVNRLTSNKYSGTQFAQLPLNIKENYYRFAVTDGQVDISGSKPGQRVSVEQDIFLNVFCCESELVSRNPGEPVDPGPGPETPAPTFDLFLCQRSMASSDLNRDDELSSDEYVIFLNRLTNNLYLGRTYDSLEADLKTNFKNLAGENDKINIFGSKPGQTSNFQNEEGLVNVCVETGNALNGTPPTQGVTPSPIVQPTAKPTMIPTLNPNPNPTAPPTFPPGRSEVFNSFIISNASGLTAADLKVGSATQSREGLEKAYETFVQTAEETYAAANENLEIRALRRRKLATSLLPDSAQFKRIVDSDCPPTVILSEKCQTVFASFQLTLESENAALVSDQYTDFTQKLIARGDLQSTLEAVDPSTVLRVVDASYPVTFYGTSAPTAAPTEKKRNVAGPVIGSLFGILILGLIIYVAIKGLPFDLPFELPFDLPINLPFELPSFLKRGGARVGNNANDDDDDEVRLGLKDGDDNSNDDKEFGLGNRMGDNDNDDDQRNKNNLFGFSPRKKNYEQNANYGLEPKEDYGKSSSDDMYAFDEPSEMETETDNQDDQGSAIDNEDSGFERKPTSDNWGTENVFESESEDQGWGANKEENFFGTSAFEEEEYEEEEEEPYQSEYEESMSEESEGSEVSEESESYSSEDDTYDSGDIEETTEELPSSDVDSGDYEELEQQESFSQSSSADESYNSASAASSANSSKMPSDLKMKNDEMDAAIDNGDWDAVVEAAKAFDKSDAESSVAGSAKYIESNDEDMDEDSDSDELYSDDESASSETTTSEDQEKREEFRTQVEELVRIVLPDETDKVDAMMDQFKGREAELVSTLQTMEERSSNQRARAAIHKSKPPSQKSTMTASQHSAGSAAGSAAIAAASLPIPAEGSFGDSQTDEFGGSFGESNAFGDTTTDDGDEYDEAEGEYDDQSYFSEEDSQASGSFYSEGEGEEVESASGSYYSEEEEAEGSASQIKSFYSQDPESSQHQGSFYSEEQGSASQQRSIYTEEEGESIDEDSYYSEGEGSQGEEEEQSYYTEEEGSSYISEEGGGSFFEASPGGQPQKKRNSL